MTLYRSLADELANQIETGVFRPGDKLPSIRAVCRHRGVSVATCVRMFHELERRSLVVAAPRSGFFVQRARRTELPSTSPARDAPVEVWGGDRVLKLLRAAEDPSIVNFGAATPHPDFMPSVDLAASSRRVWRRSRRRCATQIFPPGAIELRRNISKRLAIEGCCIDPEDVVITNGCQEAISIALSEICRRGDAVAIESPAYYGLLQVLEHLGLNAMPIPTDARTGISLPHLEQVMRRQQVSACVVTPVASNPLGVTLTDPKKRELAELASRYSISLVEDDTYGDLTESKRRSRPLKSYDGSNVYLCGSATKTFSAGLRIGWLVGPPATRSNALFQQYLRTVSVNTHAQLTLSDYFETGKVSRTMRAAATSYRHAVSQLIDAIEDCFPRNTLISEPKDGYLVWVELGPQIDMGSLLDSCVRNGVVYAPGAMFSPDGQFTNCLRLNAALDWTARTRQALSTLGRMIVEAEEPSSSANL